MKAVLAVTGLSLRGRSGAERACWPWGLRIVIGNAGHVSDVLRIAKGIDVCHRGSWGIGRYPTGSVKESR